MFRFINSGIKQSVKAIPNTLCHSPSLYTKGSDDENDTKIKHDQPLSIYKSFVDNPGYIQSESSILERKYFILDLYLDPIKSWLNTPNTNYQHNCLNNLREYEDDMTIYRLSNNDVDTVIRNKKKSLLFNKLKNENKRCISAVEMLPIVYSGFKQSTTTFPKYIPNSSPLFIEKVDDNDNKLSINQTTKHSQSICIYKSFLNYINLPSFKVLLEKKNFAWLLFLNKLLLNLEKPKWITNDQINLVDTKLDTNLLPSNEVKIEPKENPTKSVEVNIDKSRINEPLDNLQRLGHELNTKGCESAAKHDIPTALQYWNCAAIFNYPPSQFNLGAYYELNDDLISAEKWYRSAVNSGNHPDAAYNLAMLLNNKLNNLFKREICDLLHLSANQGCREAQQCIKEIPNPP